MTFQDVPCATSDAQSVLAQPKAVGSPSTKSATANTEQAAPQTSGRAICQQTGIQIFDPSRDQGLQHPQAALNLCRKTLPDPMNRDGICLDACVQAWVGEYKKKYIGNGE